MRTFTRALLTFAIVLACLCRAQAEDGVLWVQVSDPQGKPISDVTLSATGPSSVSVLTKAESEPSEVAGKVRIRLASSTKPGEVIELIIVRAPHNFVFISPWNGLVAIPCFEDKTSCVQKVVLAERGQRMLLEYPEGQYAMAAKVNKANAAVGGDNESAEVQRWENLAQVAKEHGFTPGEVDSAIRSLRKKTEDPLRLGEVALYEKNYPEAEKQLLKAKAEGQDLVANASSSLGQTYFEQDKYSESVKEYEQAVVFRQNDINLLGNLGRALYRAGQYSKAEERYKQALMLGERALGPEHHSVSRGLNNLAVLYQAQGKYAEAEQMYQRALSIYEKIFGPEDNNVGSCLNNLATLYTQQRKYADAEPLFKRALRIKEKHLGLDHPSVATSLNNLATLYSDQDKYAEAELLYKRALAIKEKKLGPNHPSVARSLNNLALIYTEQGKYREAELLYRRALPIYEKEHGPEHPEVAELLHNYAALLQDMGRGAEAEKMTVRAQAILAKQPQGKTKN